MGLKLRTRRFLDHVGADETLWGKMEKRAGKIGNSPKKDVIHLRAEGKNLTVKRRPDQLLVAYNQKQLESLHRKALESGAITARRYELVPLRYRYVNRQLGAMETVEGVGFDTLTSFLDPRKPYGPMPAKEVTMSQEFLRANPEITLESLSNMWAELRANLQDVSLGQKHFSLDWGYNNVIIRGFDRKTGRFVITLVDQLHPRAEQDVARRYNARRRAKKH